MEIIVDATFTGESLTLDGKHFIGCTLVNCLLSYSGQDVIFERTAIKGCRHVFFGRARQTVHYLQNLGLMEHELGQWAELPEVIN
ncbi:MAG: hypothetical protein ACRYFU_14715 [Janthinobacterium lividum]